MECAYCVLRHFKTAIRNIHYNADDVMVIDILNEC